MADIPDRAPIPSLKLNDGTYHPHPETHLKHVHSPTH